MRHDVFSQVNLASMSSNKGQKYQVKVDENEMIAILIVRF